MASDAARYGIMALVCILTPNVVNLPLGWDALALLMAFIFFLMAAYAWAIPSQDARMGYHMRIGERGGQKFDNYLINQASKERKWPWNRQNQNSPESSEPSLSFSPPHGSSPTASSTGVPTFGPIQPSGKIDRRRKGMSWEMQATSFARKKNKALKKTVKPKGKKKRQVRK